MSNSKQSEKIRVITICGPTASGKTALAAEFARHFPAEVVSADSRQVYREMDIGTAKATAKEQHAVRHHLIDVVDPDYNFTVSDFLLQGRVAVEKIAERGAIPLVVGGTGLYIKGLTEGVVDAPSADEGLRQQLYAMEDEKPGVLFRLLKDVDNVLAERLSPNDLVRIIRGIEVFILKGVCLSQLQQEHSFADRPYSLLKLGIMPDRALLYERINRRTVSMLEEGFVAEVEGLLKAGYDPEIKSMKTLGYKEIITYLNGECSLDEARETIALRTRQFAKRQLVWFRKDTDIIWLDSPEDSDKMLPVIEKFCFNFN